MLPIAADRHLLFLVGLICALVLGERGRGEGVRHEVHDRYCLGRPYRLSRIGNNIFMSPKLESPKLRKGHVTKLCSVANS